MTFDIPAAGSAPYLTLLLITLLPALFPVLLARRRTLKDNLKTMLGAFLLILPATLVLGSSLSASSLSLRDGKLHVAAGYFYEYERDIGDFDLARAVHGSYAAMPQAQIAWRSNGIGLPGYSAGRFTAGDRRALFVVMTDRSKVVYLPAKSGPSLLVSVEDGRQLLGALRSAAAPAVQLGARGQP